MAWRTADDAHLIASHSTNVRGQVKQALDARIAGLDHGCVGVDAIFRVLDVGEAPRALLEAGNPVRLCGKVRLEILEHGVSAFDGCRSPYIVGCGDKRMDGRMQTCARGWDDKQTNEQWIALLLLLRQVLHSERNEKTATASNGQLANAPKVCPPHIRDGVPSVLPLLVRHSHVDHVDAVDGVGGRRRRSRSESNNGGSGGNGNSEAGHGDDGQMDGRTADDDCNATQREKVSVKNAVTLTFSDAGSY